MPSFGGSNLPVLERPPLQASKVRYVAPSNSRNDSLNEALDVHPLLDELLDVLLDDDRVEGVVAEAPSDEEGAALLKPRAEDRHVEVGTSDDMRERESAAEEEPCERRTNQ